VFLSIAHCQNQRIERALGRATVKPRAIGKYGHNGDRGHRNTDVIMPGNTILASTVNDVLGPTFVFSEEERYFKFNATFEQEKYFLNKAERN